MQLDFEACMYWKFGKADSLKKKKKKIFFNAPIF